MKRLFSHATSRRLTAALAIAMLSLAALTVVGCGAEPTPESTEPEAVQPEAATPETAPSSEEVSKLEIEELVVGEGAEAVAGKTVVVHYTGWLTDGTKFDSSLDSGQPFSFSLGAGQVIPGWDEGVQGMKVGGKRKLTIPPEMGYGDQGAGGVIPPGATLVFEVELLEVQ